MVSLGLAIIVKDEVERVNTLYKALTGHVDAFYIVVSNRKAYEKLKYITSDQNRVIYRPWTDDFAAARNACHELIETDYWLWLDADDIIKPIARLKEVAQSMATEAVDVVYFPYHYKMDELGQTVNYQWRERMMRTSLKGEWKGVIHETFVPDEPIDYRRLDVVNIYHMRDAGAEERSTERNHKILLKQYDKEPRDPRDVYYLATSYFNQEDWDDAIKLFLEHIQTSGWDEEKYYSWCYIAEAELKKKAYEQATQACFGAMEILPHYPDAFYIMQQIYFETENYAKSLEWHSLGEAKPLPETNRVQDPTVKNYRAKFQAALSLLYLGQVRAAFKMMQKVRLAQPDDPSVQGLWPEFLKAYYEAEAVEKAEWLASYNKDNGGDGVAVLNSLPKELQLDPRLTDVKREIIPPKVWPEKSIVFYCGQGLEPWGPDTLDKGMGGSEEAIVYLSRELAQAGWQVTVYNDRDKEYKDGEVSYLPFTDFNPNDTFDVLIAWRSPSFHRLMKTNARLRGVDMHDYPIGHQNITENDMEYIDKVFFKSNFQREAALTVPDSKAVVVSNGVVLEQFNG